MMTIYSNYKLLAFVPESRQILPYSQELYDIKEKDDLSLTKKNYCREDSGLNYDADYIAKIYNCRRKILFLDINPVGLMIDVFA